MTQNIINQLKNIKDGDKNIHSHLKQVVSSLLIDRNNISTFQACSAQQRIHNGVSQTVYRVRQAYTHLKDYQLKQRTLVNKLNSGTEEEPQDPPSIGYVANLIQEAKAFQKFGIGFGEQQTYRIYKSLARFSLKKNAKSLKFWGKIYASQKDYYVAEGQADGGEQAGQLGPDVEPKGTGANKWTFWVCTELTGDWVELPIITPTQLKTSRLIKYMFTGNLNQTVLTNPFFMGKQSHLLKCQLVRIHTTCTLVPKGSLVLNQETNQIEAPQQYQFPDITVLAEKQNWIYQYPSLLKNGRTTLLKPEGMEPEQQQKWIKAQTLRDPAEPKLKNIILDSQKWAIKSVDLNQTYKTVGKVPKIQSKGIISLRNLVWPGWTTITYNGKISNIYIGHAHKYKQNYYPFDPQTILSQKQDKKQYVVNE